MNTIFFSRYIKPLLIFGFICGVAYWTQFRPSSPQSWGQCIGYVALGAHILLFIYEFWAWHINPFERIPRLEKKYVGRLIYQIDGTNHEKPIEVSIEQHRSFVSITTKTNESTSHSLASSIVEEEGGFSVYYVYRTTPKASVESRNPVQTGTCRIFLERVPFAWSMGWLFPTAPKALSVKYWTSQKTIGDIDLYVPTAEQALFLAPPPPSCENSKP